MEPQWKELSRFAYEIGVLKRIKRTGWWVAGIKDPETVAEHTFRCAILGYFLALMEGADPMRTALLCLIHDLPEATTGDLHRVNDLYLDAKQGSQRAFLDQTKGLPEPVAGDLMELFREWEGQTTQEARLARDADLLECLIQAIEYKALGCTSLEEWIRNTASSLTTPSARSLARASMAQDPRSWWHQLRAPRD
jgi:putative hydrolase of HD superfamily